MTEKFNCLAMPENVQSITTFDLIPIFDGFKAHRLPAYIKGHKNIEFGSITYKELDYRIGCTKFTSADLSKGLKRVFINPENIRY